MSDGTPPDARERLLEQAYDAEQAGDLIEAARLRQLVRDATIGPPATDAEQAARTHPRMRYYPIGR